MDRILSLGAPYVVTQMAPDYDFTLKEQAYKDQGNSLTNGEEANPHDLKSGWVGYMRAEGRHITVDLGSINNITEVSGRFLHYPTMGVLMPREFQVSASSDNINFYFIGSTTNKKPLFTQGPMAEKYTVKTEPILARFVRISFLTDVWTFLDQIEVRGDLEGEGKALNLAKSIVETMPKEETLQPHLAAVSGMKNMVLIYSGDNFNWQKSDFLPYVGYINQETLALEDYLFDSFLFLPYGKTADGYSFNHAGEKPSTWKHWQKYLDSLFKVGQNLNALDLAVETLKESLGLPNYQVKVEIAIPYPSPKQSSFGETASETISFNLKDHDASLNNRVQAIKLYVDMTLEKFERANYKNLEITGFYWLEENVSYSSTPKEAELLRRTAEIVHQNRLAFHWIPFVQAEGFREWRELGFDLAMMQPNYFFHPNAKEDRLENNAKLARKYGLSVEIEVSNQVFRTEDYRQRFKQYLQNAAKYNFTNNLLGYYQDTNLFGLAALSKDPEKREIYDWVYRFIHQGQAPR